MQEDEERLNDSQAGCSSMLGGLMSENNYNDKVLGLTIPADGKDSESTYSKFKAQSSGLFTL